MKKIIIYIIICFVYVNSFTIVACAVNTFSLTLTKNSPAYIQVPRSSNYTYVSVNINSIDDNSPVNISVVDSSHKRISNNVVISGLGSYILNYNTPIASGTDVYVRFYSGYYPINISGYVA